MALIKVRGKLTKTQPRAMFRGWRHWEVRVGRWLICRWCSGAPCGYVPDSRHPLNLYRIREWR